MVFSHKFNKSDHLRDLWRLVSETCMHWIPQNLFLLSLKQDNFSNSTIIVLGPSPPFIYLKKCDIFAQIQQKWHSQRPVVAPFRDMRSPTSRKHISTDLKKRSLSLKFSKNDTLRHLQWLVSETHIHRLPSNMFLLRLRQDHLHY